MKSHSIIPIFLPELGCPNKCVYCNQKHISGQYVIPDAEEVKNKIEKYLSTIKGKGIYAELAFFGGSFTSLSLETQIAYVEIAQPYLKDKSINNIRISTRPDAISEDNIVMLKQYGVSIIELGVQSLDDDVLMHCGRGYESSVVYEAAEKVIANNISLGMQMMIGLPHSTYEKDLFTAKEIIRIGAHGARIYPLLVFANTDLEHLYNKKEYIPLSVDDAIERSVDILELFLESNVKVYKIGLHPSEFIDNGTLIAGPWIPAFRQHVQAKVWQRKFEKELKNDKLIKGFFINQSDINSAIGPNKCNIEIFKQKGINLSFRIDNSLKRGDFYAFYS